MLLFQTSQNSFKDPKISRNGQNDGQSVRLRDKQDGLTGRASGDYANSTTLFCLLAGRGGGPRTRLNGKQNEWSKIDDSLKLAGLKRVRAPADGNCQFHAVAAHSHMTHSELRIAVTQFLVEHQDAYIDFFSRNESFATYVQELANPGTWGDNLSLLVMAELLQSPIHVAQSHGVQIISPSLVSGQPIWVAYNGDSHYDSVFPCGISFKPNSSQVMKDNPTRVRSPDSTTAVVGNSATSCAMQTPAEAHLNLAHQLFPEDPSSSSLPTRVDLKSWLFLSANITSFSAQHNSLLEIPFEVAALQETRHTVKSQNQFSLILKKAGFKVIWGKHQPFRAGKSGRHTSTGLNGRPGGVAIIAQDHLPLQFIPPGECDIRKRLFHSCRWVHGAVAFGNCKQVVHIFSIYGFTGSYTHSRAAELNEAFFSDILEVLAISRFGPRCSCFNHGRLQYRSVR